MLDKIPSLFLDLTLSERKTKIIHKSTSLQLKKWTSVKNLKSFFVLVTDRTTWRDSVYNGSLRNPSIVWDEHESVSPTLTKMEGERKLHGSNKFVDCLRREINRLIYSQCRVRWTDTHNNSTQRDTFSKGKSCEGSHIKIRQYLIVVML